MNTITKIKIINVLNPKTNKWLGWRLIPSTAYGKQFWKDKGMLFTNIQTIKKCI